MGSAIVLPLARARGRAGVRANNAPFLWLQGIMVA